MSEKKDRVTDALNATKAAVEEGIVPGANRGLCAISSGTTDLSLHIQHLRAALKASRLPGGDVKVFRSLNLHPAGGGTALLYASKGLVDGFKERGQLANFDQQVPRLPLLVHPVFARVSALVHCRAPFEAWAEVQPSTRPSAMSDQPRRARQSR